MLNEITIKGYKSIKNLENFKLNNLNILIGANGAGKSNFLSVFKMVRLLYNQKLQWFVQNKGIDNLLYFGKKVTNNIYFEFNFNKNKNGYNINLSPTNENQLLILDENILYMNNGSHTYNIGSNLLESHLSEADYHASSCSVASYVINAINKWKIYHFHDTSDTSAMKSMCSINDNLILKADASNIAAYIHMLYNKYPLYYKQIVQIIQEVAPFFGGFIIRDNENIQLEWFDKSDPDTPFKAHMLSDGTLRFICLATLLLQPSKLMPSTIIIDEPELGLHPYAIFKLSELIKMVSETTQLIISSQSTELINCFSPKDIIVVNKEDNQSVLTRLDEEKLKNWLKDYSIGELWNSNLICGRP